MPSASTAAQSGPQACPVTAAVTRIQTNRDAPPLQVAPQRRGIPQGNEGVLSTQGRGLGLQPDKTYYMGTPHPQGRGPAPKEGV